MNNTDIKGVLPEKPSALLRLDMADLERALLRLAMADLELVEGDNAYMVDMRVWHMPVNSEDQELFAAWAGMSTQEIDTARGRCVVCFAGAVLAKTVQLPADSNVGILLDLKRDGII